MTQIKKNAAGARGPIRGGKSGTHHSTISAEAVKAAACGRWLDVLGAAGIDPELLDGRGHPCPKCGGTDRFSTFKNTTETGGLICRKCFAENNGDGLAAVQWIRGCTFPEALAIVSEHLGLDRHVPTNDKPADSVNAASKPKSNGNSNDKPRIVAQYDYRDEAGNVLSQAVRYEPKDFRQRRPKSGGGWDWSVKGVRVVPYRLPELLAEPARSVVVAEGEKDCDNLARIGVLATCNACGAGKWTAEHSEFLRGRRVIVLPDNDEPGRNHAQQVAQSLQGIAASVQIVELPGLLAKGDASDWIESQPDAREPADIREELERLAEAAPVWTPAETETLDSFAVEDCDPDPWPDPLADEAMHGLAGEIVRTIEPHTEADGVSLLATLLAGFGGIIGRSAHFQAEGDRHFGNLFACLVGSTSKGRKGTSWGRIRAALEPADPDWAAGHVLGGLSSGEGLIWAVRDPIHKTETVYEGTGKSKRAIGTQPVCVDEGITDKRLLVLESEFGSVLKVILREKNTLSAIMRQAWDRGDLATLTKNSPAKATGAHISILGHITAQELRRLITETDLANGLANRFLWFCVRRSKCLPEGGNLDDRDLDPLVDRLQAAVQFACSMNEPIRRDEQAREIWHAVYPRLSAGQPGLLGAATSRAEAQVMRLAILYAVLDCSYLIRPPHLMAALAVWKYAEQSARYVFGSAMGDPMADAIYSALKARPEGMTRNDIREYFGRNKAADEIGRSLAALVEAAKARRESRTDTGGRPAEVWFAS